MVQNPSRGVSQNLAWMGSVGLLSIHGCCTGTWWVVIVLSSHLADCWWIAKGTAWVLGWHTQSAHCLVGGRLQSLRVWSWGVMSWSNFYQIHSNPIKMTPFGSTLTTHPNPTPVWVQIHSLPPEIMQHVNRRIMLSILSLFTSFKDTIWFHGPLITPYLHWAMPWLEKGSQTHSSFVEQLLDEQWALTSHGPHLVQFLFS